MRALFWNTHFSSFRPQLQRLFCVEFQHFPAHTAWIHLLFLPPPSPSPYRGPIPSKSMKTVGMYIHNQILLKYYLPYSVSCDSIFSAWTFETLSFHIFSVSRRLLQPFTLLLIRFQQLYFHCITCLLWNVLSSLSFTIYSFIVNFFEKRGLNFRFSFFFEILLGFLKSHSLSKFDIIYTYNLKSKYFILINIFIETS